jgi:sulfatase modifying factor 1
MKLAVFAVAVLLFASAIVGCDSILGIDEFPNLAIDSGGADAALDANFDGGVDSSLDGTIDQSTSDASHDGTVDAPSDQQTTCSHPCTVGETRCLAGTVYETCIGDDAGCEAYTAPLTCPSGGGCWGEPGEAYCCAGGAGACAPSCRPGLLGPDGGDGQTNCGRDGTESCCTTLDVGGGSFLRSYDDVVNTDATNPATVSRFALDKFEVTVGRFRLFVNDTVNTVWRPDPGSGIHTHLNGGLGLVDSSATSADGGFVYEQGWVSTYDGVLPSTLGDWDSALECNGAIDTWTSSPGTTEAYPINCVTWEEAYAFCIWDGGFLPSETEWNFAGSAGSDQRVYPWSTPSTDQTLDCTYANYDACGGTASPVGSLPNGDGRWGQSDLTGNVWEWTLDYFAAYVTPCVDCAYLSATSDGRTIRGASFNYPANALYVQTRGNDPDTVRYSNDGFRCARTP